MTKKIDQLILFIWVYIIIALPPFAIIFLLKSISPESDFSAELADKTPDFPAIVTAALILPAIGAILSIFRKKIKAVYFWSLEKQEKIHIATISLLFSIVLWQFFSVLSFLGFFGLVVLFIFFLLYLPLTNIYLCSIDFTKLKLLIAPVHPVTQSLRSELGLHPKAFWGYRVNKKSIPIIIENTLFALVVLLLIHTFVIATDVQIRAYNHYQLFLSRHPKIQSINPKIVYYGTKVILMGREFGWKGTIDTKFKYKEGNIDITLWTDTKVVFTIPLHWREGNITIWMQKPIEWEGREILVKSNMVKLRLISRDNGWDKDDDAYFEQLKSLSDEVLQLNGYAPKK